MTGQPQQHPLIIVKCWSVSFQALKSGDKRFEYRKDDRPYDVGVTVKQEEWNPDTEYTGDFLYHDITWIIRGGVFGIPEGYCIFSVTEPRKTQCASHSSAGAQQQRIEQVDKKLCQLGDMIHEIQYARKVSAEVINDLDDVLGVYREVREAIALLQAGDQHE